MDPKVPVRTLLDKDVQDSNRVTTPTCVNYCSNMQGSKEILDLEKSVMKQ